MRAEETRRHPSLSSLEEATGNRILEAAPPEALTDRPRALRELWWAAIGKDYLACAAARSGAGCSNRTSIRRSRVEEVVLEGLKGRLMEPELVEEFTRAFHEEVNRQNSARELRVVEH